MEAAPRLPMSSFDLKICTENVQFGPQLKQYIATFYNEDPESYSTEIHNLEALRASAVRPSLDVNGVQLLKRYYCQLHFLKSRFPMEENQDAAIQFLWKDNQAGMNCGGSDIRFELMIIMYNIGALHSYLGATDSRSNPEGMKMACTHFQCAAWAFQTVKEKYHQFIIYISSVELIHFFQQVCLAQAQECILEKSMLDNRKASIIAKVAVQVYNYYRQSLTIFQSANDELIGSKSYKEWTKYLQFKVAYHKCIALLYQGQQAEEQQKMGERVAFYQAASEQLEEARKLASTLKNRQQEINESLAFTLDVVEGKRKAAKNENEFIYHEEVPDKDHLQEVKGASLVKGIPFSVTDVEVSGPDIFARLVPMEAHEAASLYSEKKAQMLRQIGELVEIKDQALAEFMSSMQLDLPTKMNQATGIPQDLIDRSAALSARPTVTQDLADAMGKLSGIYQDVESSLTEISALLKEEEEAERDYQEVMGKRPPSIIATDLAREAAKYKEAHSKANDSNQTLHRAMTAHVANLKILQQPLRQLQTQLPAIDLPNANIDEKCLKDLEALVAKVDEMRTQRVMLWAQFRDSVHKDDITNSLVTKQPHQSLEQLFQQELQKHQQLASLIEQNCTAQDNIKKALVDCYAKAINTRRYIQDVIQKRNNTVAALIASHDSYEDLLAKANKGIEFYTKLETNVSKLLQRIRSACKVQQEEREQMLSKNDLSKREEAPPVQPPRLKDYLDSRKKNVPAYPEPNVQYQQPVSYGVTDTQTWPPAVRPTPLGSEFTDLPKSSAQEVGNYAQYAYGHVQPPSNVQYPYQSDGGGGYSTQNVDPEIINRMNALLSNIKGESSAKKYAAMPHTHSTYIPQNYDSTTYSYTVQPSDSFVNAYDPSKAFTTTTNSYRPLSSYTVPNDTSTHMQYPDSSLGKGATFNADPSASYQHPNYRSLSAEPSQAPNHPSSQTTNNNAYYPSGYGPTNTAPTQMLPTPMQGQYHSLEYATSVQPNQSNFSYNPTYSSPVVNMSSAHARDAALLATGGVPPNQQTYPAPNTPAPETPVRFHNAAQTVSEGLSPSLTSLHDPSGTSSYQQYQNSQAYSTGTGTGTQAYTSSAQYYPPGTYQFYHPSASGTSNGHQTQWSPDPTAGQASAYTNVAQQNVPVSTRESNIDLLSGLDFTISHAPLVPQQKAVPRTEEGAAPPSPAERVNAPRTAVKEERAAQADGRRLNVRIMPSKPLNNNDVRRLFGQEVERYEKYVETLTNKTLSGPTNLDIKWKEMQESEGQKRSISVARCYPMKNRFPDILPYDYSRVELEGAKDDYINASFIKDVSPYAPPFIVTQTPLASTVGDFWTMIREQQVELIFCMSNDAEIGDDVYWPKEKGRHLNVTNMDHMIVSLQSVIVKSHWTERLISISLPEKRNSRVVMHLQFTSWPGSLFPTTPEPFVSYVLELIALYQQQRCVAHPIVVHCSSGIGKSGLACLLTNAIFDVTNNANSVPDLVSLSIKLMGCRKNILRDREHLKFGYEAFLSYMKQVVSQDKKKKKMNEVVPKLEDESKQSVDVVERDEDPLSRLDPFWASKK